MEQKIIFREMLSEIKALADSRNNRLTTAEIDAFFSNAHLEKEHLEMIYEYLAGQKIEIVGYQKETENRFTDTAENSDQPSGERNPLSGLELYLEEVERIERPDEKEEFRLFSLAAQGDAGAKSRLAEIYLPMVCELAGEYEGKDCLAEDLVQEGNVGLLLAVNAVEKQESLAAYRACLMNAVNQFMQDAIQDQKDVREMGDGIAKRVNHLNEAIQNLEEDLEHKVSVDELSAYLEMPAEEIRDILKMAGDEIKIEGNEY
ncbi:MAG: sigma factor [Lachnospiraceae bacterium]|nr:sigma factor [Lachnospiraceae bacterium]